MNEHLTPILQRQSILDSFIGDHRRIDLCVQEREDVLMKWQQEQLLHQQHQQSFMINDNNLVSMLSFPIQDSVSKQDNAMGSGWNAYGVEDMNWTIPRTISCPPAMTATMAANHCSVIGKQNTKKRKLNITHSLKEEVEGETKDKKMKGCIQEVDSRLTEKQSNRNNNNNNNNNNKELSTETSHENSKVSEVRKLDYIHVRARRGEATDSHSLAERVRREKISERMRYLQELVPGCNKMSGKAGIIDEIINYVQSLQTQVEFLSMKLATTHPTIDYNIENLLNEEVNEEVVLATSHEFSTIGLSPATVNPGNIQFNPLQVPCSGLETNVSRDMALRRTTSAPLSLPETHLDQLYLNQIQHTSAWDSELENIYSMELQQGKLSSPFTQPFTGYMEGTQVKLEM